MISKRMDLKRIIEIIEAYGSRPESWPMEERESAIAFVKTHPKTEDYRMGQQTLDFALDEVQASNIDINALSSRILAKIELSQFTFIDRVLNWLFPVKTFSLWQPALAAALPIAMGIFLGAQISVVDDEWDQEFYLNSFSNNSFDLYPINLNSNEANLKEAGND